MAILQGVLVVAGVPGTGKSFLASLISRTWQCSTLKQEELLREYLKPDPYRDTMVLDESQVDMVKIRSLLGTLSSTQRCIVLETVYPGFWLRNFQDLISLVILLRVHPLSLCARLASRPWPKGKVLENCLAEALDSMADELLGYEDKVVEIDATRLEEVAHLLQDKVSRGRTGLTIFWLERDEDLADVVSYWSMLLDLYNYGFRE
ncbi:MAG: hypothetical protein F7C07_05075 [Desulfurococcales archaeon]|nr:hypothetical protein [Desulfurococcales archaeon]